MTKKAHPFRCFLLLLLAAGALCLAACKMEPDPFVHVSPVNPFIGVWKEVTQTGAVVQYWNFKVDGTGGRANTQGTFPDSFSFFIYAGQDVRTTPSEGDLITLDDSGVVTRYDFDIFYYEGKQTALLTGKSPGSSDIMLQRVSGSPQVLNLANPLVGEWSADWSSEHGRIWSLKYRADGTVKTYHHDIGHQFENAYALRGNTLVIFGDMRFVYAPKAEITSLGNNKWRVVEKQSFYKDTSILAEWVYTKVAAAKWRDG